MINEKEWQEFCLWCKQQWSAFVPDRSSVELYLGWKNGINGKGGLPAHEAAEQARAKAKKSHSNAPY